MIPWLGRLLYESTPAEFRSAYSVAESVERLLAATKRSAFSALDEARAVGKVSSERVRLQRVIPMVQNSFKPFFSGSFQIRDGVTVLTGHFGMSMFVKIFMTFWLGMVALFFAGFLLASLSSKASFAPWVVMGPLFMLLAGAGLVALGKWFARNDVAWLSGVIAQALGVSGAGAPKLETQIDPTAVPMVLKGVALFLAASSAMVIFMDFFGPRVLPAQLGDSANPTLQLGHWHVVYAVSGLVLAVGVWRRRPWAWWGGFLGLGMSIITSLLSMPVSAQQALPPMIRVVFVIFALIVVEVWGRWWYAQRRHFFWTEAPPV
jgi:hypothetical protein